MSFIDLRDYVNRAGDSYIKYKIGPQIATVKQDKFATVKDAYDPGSTKFKVQGTLNDMPPHNIFEINSRFFNEKEIKNSTKRPWTYEIDLNTADDSVNSSVFPRQSWIPQSIDTLANVVYKDGVPRNPMAADLLKFSTLTDTQKAELEMRQKSGGETNALLKELVGLFKGLDDEVKDEEGTIKRRGSAESIDMEEEDEGELVNSIIATLDKLKGKGLVNEEEYNELRERIKLADKGADIDGLKSVRDMLKGIKFEKEEEEEEEKVVKPPEELAAPVEPAGDLSLAFFQDIPKWEKSGGDNATLKGNLDYILANISPEIILTTSPADAETIVLNLGRLDIPGQGREAYRNLKIIEALYNISLAGELIDDDMKIDWYNDIFKIANVGDLKKKVGSFEVILQNRREAAERARIGAA